MTESDRVVVEGLRAGDEAAFEALYERHFRRIHNFCLRKLSDRGEAEDVTQEVFEAVLNGIGRFEGRSDLIVWIYGITRNLINNRLRKRAGMRLIPLDDLPADAAPRDCGPQPRAEAREALRRVEAAIERLPREQRRILELRHGRRLAIREIADLLERSEDAVKSSLYRARRSLASQLGPAQL